MKNDSIRLIAGSLASIVLLHASLAEAAKEKVIYSFPGGTGGASPVAGLFDLNGTLYGTTYAEGANNEGTAFSLNPKTGAAQVLHSFGNGTDGELPEAGLLDVKGTLFGTTADGGTDKHGIVFSLDPASGVETVVHAFAGGADGLFPGAGLIRVNGTLYGTTFTGGVSSNGTVFSIDPNSGAESVVYSFQGSPSDGAGPTAGLLDLNGTLYGTTSDGGKFGEGTVFSVGPTTGAERTLYSFHGTEGELPLGGLIAVNGTLYGTTDLGGLSGKGEVFSLDPKSNRTTVVYSFTGYPSDGAGPSSALTEVKGALYGTTVVGGPYNDGTVFSINPANGAETVVHTFGKGADGQMPNAALIDVKGKLYGTTETGGVSDAGTVFSIKP